MVEVGIDPIFLTCSSAIAMLADKNLFISCIYQGRGGGGEGEGDVRCLPPLLCTVFLSQGVSLNLEPLMWLE